MKYHSFVGISPLLRYFFYFYRIFTIFSIHFIWFHKNNSFNWTFNYGYSILIHRLGLFLCIIKQSIPTALSHVLTQSFLLLVSSLRLIPHSYKCYLSIKIPWTNTHINDSSSISIVAFWKSPLLFLNIFTFNIFSIPFNLLFFFVL